MNKLYYVFGMVPVIGGPILGYLTYKWKVRVDLNARAEGLDIDAKKQALTNQDIPIQLLKDELAKREQELAAMREQDRVERIQHAETMTAVRNALEEIVTDLRSHREEEKQRSANFHERLDTVDDRLLVIETQLGVKKPA